jgi:S-DNA-T family DNA segregation ATPase FtsK/SpoIIIE
VRGVWTYNLDFKACRYHIFGGVLMFRKKHPIVKKMFKVFLEKKFVGTYINRVYKEDDTLYANIHLPEHKDTSDLEKLLPNLQEEVGATAVKLGKKSGKSVEILFGMRKLQNNTFSSSLLHENSLKVTFPSSYGEYILDFEDGASCHMLNGGTTRMGKTCLLLYLSTVLFLQNKGNMKLYIVSVKLKDYYPFEGFPQVKMALDEIGFLLLLKEIEEEYEKRNKLLYSSALAKATDAKSVRKLYPDYYSHFKPLFIIIDEYGQFSHNPEIQKMVTKIAETAGFVNIHLIICSQRPDAQTVLRPRLRANLMVRMAFTTVDKKNSEIILDSEGAEKLGEIAGRAIVRDGGKSVIQVPFIDAVECDKLLEPYRREDEKKDEQDTERPINNEVADKIQSMLSQSDSLLDLSEEFQSSECSEQSIEKNVIGWSHFPNTEGT